MQLHAIQIVLGETRTVETAIFQRLLMSQYITLMQWKLYAGMMLQNKDRRLFAVVFFRIHNAYVVELELART